MSKIKELLCVSDEEVKCVREEYNKTEKDINEDVNILLNWLEKQPHLPKPHDRDRLERFLLRNKFRIEKTKIKLDNYYSFKVLYPEYYRHLDPECDIIKNLKKALMIVPMPKLLPNFERLYFFKLMAGEEENYNFVHQVLYTMKIWELQLSYDYCSAEMLLWDIRDMSFKHILKMDINVLKRGFEILRQAYSARISRLVYINVLSSLVDVSLNIVKQVTDSKFFEKVRIHKDTESLYEYVPREYLPNEIGGTAGSAKEIFDQWEKELILQNEFLKLHASRVSNEQLRTGEIKRNELFGMEGTFRKLNLD